MSIRKRRAGAVHVVGGGLAGLAAALAVAESGRRVTIYEAGPACGGRCRSYFDRELGCRIDNGNHLLLSGNRAAMDFLRRTGAEDTLTGPATPVFPFIDLRTGQRWTLRPNTGRLPWWVLFASRGVPGVRLADYARLARMRRAGPDDTVGGMLRHDTLYERLIEPLTVSALNTPADQGSARLMWAVIAETLARGGAHCIPRFPRHGLSESFVDPALARIAALGGTVRTSYRIATLATNEQGVTALLGPEPTQIAADEDVILAIPPQIATALHPGLSAPTEHEAILNLHFRTTAAPGEAGFFGLVGGLAEWVFVKQDVVSVTISAANRHLHRDNDELARDVWPEVCATLGVVAELPPFRVIREKRATFAATPQQHMRRPGATSTLPNLTIAGDWTNTGLPATIEGAIRSGFVAAQQTRLS